MSWRAAALVLLFIGCATIAGCQRAARYQAAIPVKAVTPDEKLTAQPTWSWQLPQYAPQADDAPIVFIAHGHPEWDGLRQFWTDFPPRAAGTRTIHFGQSPLAIAGTMLLAGQLESVKIKVPLGLPDPTPNIPAGNPPTRERWRLGRQIFFARKLVGGADTFACVTCHKPAFGFAEENRPITHNGIRNTLSLINSVYNHHQFWDGRATALEEVLVRTLDDELISGEKPPRRWPQEIHRWGGLVRALDGDIDIRTRFEMVFGLKQPTQDAIAKALATYMRTILSGDSLYDRAEQERRGKKDPILLATHFESMLDARALASLQADAESKDAVAKKLERGHKLFQANGCATCHPAPLFTDHDFHNIGIGESVRFRKSGEETGRFAHVPIGLKETRLIGAFRTPTLRALPRTAPYFHDGSASDLRIVVTYFARGVNDNRYLAAPLRIDALGHARQLELSEADQAALILFLRTLDGEPVDLLIVTPP